MSNFSGGLPAAMQSKNVSQDTQPDFQHFLAFFQRWHPASTTGFTRQSKDTMQLRPLILALTAIAFTCAASAHDARIGALHILHPAAPASLPGQTSGVVYLSIDNDGTTADALRSLSSPAAANIAIHTMKTDDNIMRMREIDSLPLPPGAKISMKAGSGYHLMLTGLKQPLKAGDKIPLTLNFEKAGKLEVSVHVGPNLTSPPGQVQHQHSHAEDSTAR